MKEATEEINVVLVNYVAELINAKTEEEANQIKEHIIEYLNINGEMLHQVDGFFAFLAEHSWMIVELADTKTDEEFATIKENIFAELQEKNVEMAESNMSMIETLANHIKKAEKQQYESDFITGQKEGDDYSDFNIKEVTGTDQQETWTEVGTPDIVPDTPQQNNNVITATISGAIITTLIAIIAAKRLYFDKKFKNNSNKLSR